MPSLADVFSVIHYGVLTAFVGITSVSMLVAVVARLRIRRPLLVWRTGPISRYPIGPSLFLVGVAGGLAYAFIAGRSVPPSVMIGYPAGGVFWFVATWLARSVVVTEYGLVHDLSRLHRAVAWSQIVDYAETTQDDGAHLIFFYRDEDDRQHRLDLPVPEACLRDLREIVHEKLDARYMSFAKQAYGPGIFDRPGDFFGRT